MPNTKFHSSFGYRSVRVTPIMQKCRLCNFFSSSLRMLRALYCSLLVCSLMRCSMLTLEMSNGLAISIVAPRKKALQ
jgi:hypothetical protein